MSDREATNNHRKLVHDKLDNIKQGLEALHQNAEMHVKASIERYNIIEAKVDNAVKHVEHLRTTTLIVAGVGVLGLVGLVAILSFLF